MEAKRGDRIIGIDLGTTNSLVAVMRDGAPEVLRTREGGTLLPSVVSFAKEDEKNCVLVGERARRLRTRDPKNTVYSVKRLLGRGFADLADVMPHLPYELEPGEGIARIRAGGRLVTPIEVSALVLAELKASAEAALGEKVSRAVITVPAYFNDSQRQATRAAGRIAGLEVVRILNEPTAAALAYGIDRKREGKIAVFDLGGGTFDISILRLKDGLFEVLATNGDTALGGDDFDQALAGWLRDESKVEDLTAEERALLLEAAESAKIALSTAERTVVELPLRGRPLRREVTRKDFERLTLPVLERVRAPCLGALRDAGLRCDELTDVVLVGGPTRLGSVRRMAREIFGREPDVSMHPEEVVALGAAIQADVLSGRNRDALLLDVIPLSLGIETYGGVMSVLIPRNTRIPASARETFTTFVEGQTGVDLHVLQGERDRVEDNRSLARFKLGGLAPGPAGSARVEVTFLVDADGILQASGRDQKTGREQSIEVKPSFGLTDAEVERMLVASAEHAREDVEFRKLVEARNEAEPVARATERRLADAERLLEGPERAEIRDRLAELERALAGRDPERIREQARLLDRATTRLAELLVLEAISARQVPQGSTRARKESCPE